MASGGDRIGARFAGLLNHIFDTHRHPSGREYSLREISERSGGKLTTAYISLLRKGGVANPPADRVQALADAFDVDVRYFTGQQASERVGESNTERALRLALSDPLIHAMVLSASQVGDAEKALFLHMLDEARTLTRKSEEEDPPPTTSREGEKDASPHGGVTNDQYSPVARKRDDPG